MSIFNFRRGRPSNAKASSKSSSQSAPESVEVVRKRAKHRLIGSAVLVLIGVVGFPLLFESQPRPVPVDIAIEIPSRSAVKPASPIQPVSRPEPASAVDTGAGQDAGAVSAQSSLQGKEEIVDGKAPAAQPQADAISKPDAKVDAKPEAKAEPAPEAKTDPKPKADDGQRAKALLDGAAPPAGTAAESRLVVQVGAFSDANKARDVRAKLEKAGMKTYTQVAETKDGKRIRVRVGPYATKAEAEKAAAKIKTLDLPASILTL